MTTRNNMAEATEWFMRLKEEPVSAETIAAWTAWCKAHPDNAATYRGLQEIWLLASEAGCDDWPEPQQVRDDEYTGEIPVAEWRRRRDAMHAALATRPWRPRRWAQWGVLFAACLALLLVGAWQFSPYFMRVPPTGVYSSERGEKRQLYLPDGSKVVLGGATAIDLGYDDTRRAIRLLHGEAFFEVKRDKNRPFVVSAPNLEVTALGTAFTVRADAARTVVSVTEGLVEVAPGPPSTSGTSPPKAKPEARRATDAVRAKAGEEVTFDGKTQSPVLRDSDVQAAVGWQDGKLTYVDEPLRAVVARINRYSKEEVVLGDPSLGELRFTGTVFKHQVHEWALGLERVFPIRVERADDGALTLTRRE